MKDKAEGEVRCPVCEASPLLATYGFDEKGRLYLHVKVYKARSVKADVFIRGGEVTLKCTRCMKYNTVRIVDHRPVLNRTRRPVISAANPPPTSLHRA